MNKRYLKVEGNSYDRGIQIGKALKDKILTNYLNQEYYYKAKEDFEYQDWAKMAMRYESFIKEWTPEVFEELKGMAEGSGIEFGKILALTTAYEKSFDRNLISDKCTSFFLSSEATKNGETIAAQTNDENLREWRSEVDVVIHHKSETSFEVLTYTHPGVPAYMGMNNKGLSVLWTYIDNGQANDGVPTNAIIRQLLNFHTIEEAVAFLEKIPHDIPNNFSLADRYGNLICVECFPNKVYVAREKNAFYHTNHNIYATDEEECTCGKTTWERFESIKNLTEKNWGNIDADMAKDFLRSHDKDSNSICVHPTSDHPWSKTLAAMVYELDKGIMNIAFGNPCEMAYNSYTFDSYI